MKQNREAIEDWHPSLRRLCRNDKKPHGCHAERNEASRIFIYFAKTRSFGCCLRMTFHPVSWGEG
jgi:hypothetical protein